MIATSWIRSCPRSSRSVTTAVFQSTQAIFRITLIGFAALIALEQLQIAPSLLNILFTAIVGAAAIAFGLAFGLGGQDAARRWLNRGENTVSGAACQIQSPQGMRNDGSAAQTAPQVPSNQTRTGRY